VTAGEVSGEGTNTITITAEQEAIDATLAANGLIYTPGLNFNGNDALTVTADDFRNAVVAKQAAITVSAVNDAPVLAHAGPSASMHGFTVLDPDLTVSDAGLDSLNGGAGNYAGATFTIERQGGGNPDDGFFIDGSSGITVGANNVLQINGQTFATASVANNSLTISFTSSGTTATSALVDNFLQHIGYENSSAAPGSNVTLDYTFDDGAPHFGSNAGHSTATASIQVNITGPIFAHETSSVYAPPNLGAVLEPGLTVYSNCRATEAAPRDWDLPYSKRRRRGHSRAHAELPSPAIHRTIAADIFLRLAWSGAQTPHQPRKLDQCLIDIVLALHENAVAQRGFELLADAIIDDVLGRHVVCRGRPGDRGGEIGRDLDIETNRLRSSHPDPCLLHDRS
jgi:hypothetical protein